MSLLRIATQRSNVVNFLPNAWRQKQLRAWYTKSTAVRAQQLQRAPLTIEEINANPAILKEINTERAKVDELAAVRKLSGKPDEPMAFDEKLMIGTFVVIGGFVLLTMIPDFRSSYHGEDDY
jgi:hypothetical protein